VRTGKAHPPFVDLHGLHVQEALSVLQQYVEQGPSTAPGSGKQLVISALRVMDDRPSYARLLLSKKSWSPYCAVVGP
jgi:hypothetical protein